MFEDEREESQNNLRLAIVIANSDYRNPTDSKEMTYGDLPSSKNNALDIVKLLKNLNFTVYESFDEEKDENEKKFNVIKNIVAEYKKNIERRVLIFFYYSGHG
jgi:hypothetical protein